MCGFRWSGQCLPSYPAAASVDALGGFLIEFPRSRLAFFRALIKLRAADGTVARKETHGMTHSLGTSVTGHAGIALRKAALR